MAKRLMGLPLLLLLLATGSFPPAAAGRSGGGDGVALNWIRARAGCRGTIAECLAGEEFDLSSEVSRRILQSSSGYISYDALRADSVPCSARGASYYNCQPGAQANPYSRGCSSITQCRS